MTMYLVTKSGMLLGVCVQDRDGWRFGPQTSAHKRSRKAWPSATACIPEWAFKKSHDLLTREEWKAREEAAYINAGYHITDDEGRPVRR